MQSVSNANSSEPSMTFDMTDITQTNRRGPLSPNQGDTNFPTVGGKINRNKPVFRLPPQAVCRSYLTEARRDWNICIRALVCDSSMLQEFLTSDGNEYLRTLNTLLSGSAVLRCDDSLTEDMDSISLCVHRIQQLNDENNGEDELVASSSFSVVNAICTHYLEFFDEKSKLELSACVTAGYPSNKGLLAVANALACKVPRKSRRDTDFIVNEIVCKILSSRPIANTLTGYLAEKFPTLYCNWFREDSELLTKLESDLIGSAVPLQRLKEIGKELNVWKFKPCPTRSTKHSVAQQIARGICVALRSSGSVIEQLSTKYPEVFAEFQTRFHGQHESEPGSEWLKVPSKETLVNCLEAYRQATTIGKFVPCDVCLRSDVQISTTSKVFSSVEAFELYFTPVRSPPSEGGCQEHKCPHVPWCNYFVSHATCSVSSDTDSGFSSGSLYICKECETALDKSKMPKFSPANDLWRGRLPSELQDLTWIEEKVCAIYHATVHVTRLYGVGSSAEDPLVMHGNTVAHSSNVKSTASVLPNAPADVRGMLSVVFVGARAPTKDQLKRQFLVRKDVISRILRWLKANNELYRDIPIDDHILDLYPKFDVLPGLYEELVVDIREDALEIFQRETAGIDPHPAEEFISSNPETDSIFLERLGVSDPNGTDIPGRALLGSALKNLWGSGKKRPDLILAHSNDPVIEYNNPHLLPGLFPSLFPNGKAGMELPGRSIPIAFKQHARYLLELHDRRLRRHKTFIFVVFNILQRRETHLNVHFTTQKRNFGSMAEKLCKLTPILVNGVSKHLEEEKPITEFTEEQKSVYDLMKELNATASKIPGSQASKIVHRNTIKSFVGKFGLPHIYLTLNPNATHSPIFQVFAGNDTIDLSERFPTITDRLHRARQVADDPVAAANFFQFSIDAVFEHLLGWDPIKKKSKPDGGVLGKLECFVGSAEYTCRGGLHGHFLIRLSNGMNPTNLRKKLDTDVQYVKRFTDYFDSVISTGIPEPISDRSVLPLVSVANQARDPRTTRPASAETYSNNEELWVDDIRFCAEPLQRHTCRQVCFKYRSDQKCRFGFPRETVSESYYETAGQSVIMKVDEPDVNNYNPVILLGCRHNHDIQSILSRRAAAGAIIYLTDYITKSDEPLHSTVSMLARAIDKNSGENLPDMNSQGKKILQSCMTEFGRKQQIHAQQAARYIFGFEDTFYSHDVVPLLSHGLMDEVYRNFGVPASGSDGSNLIGSDDYEGARVIVEMDEETRRVKCSQVEDYIFRDEKLRKVNFYHFVSCFRKVKGAPSRDFLPRKKRFSLLPPHPDSETHTLTYRNGDSSLNIDVGPPVVPRMIGQPVPRESSVFYSAFMLAHFKPWSSKEPILVGKTYEDEFQSFQFDQESSQIMENWQELYRSQDARDADRLRKREESQLRGKETDQYAHVSNEKDLESHLIDAVEIQNSPDSENLTSNTKQLLESLKLGGWLVTGLGGQVSIQLEGYCRSILPPAFTELDIVKLKRAWTAEQKYQEDEISRLRTSAHEDSVPLTDANPTTSSRMSFSCPASAETLVCDPSSSTNRSMSRDEFDSITSKISVQFELNDKQRHAYRLATERFWDMRTDAMCTTPLRLLLTGPGGTGKTHVVKALRAVMRHFNCENEIRMLAPTGSAAALIEGSTIHSGLNISVIKNKKSKSSRVPGHDTEEIVVDVPVTRRDKLRREWRLVSFVLVDEVSLMSAQLLCDLDQALRCAKEVLDEPFGGINVIFCGDFGQYSPVQGSPLYQSISNKKTGTGLGRDQLKARLGRLAWESVNAIIELTEQKRMESDKEFADAVLRLRNRTCTESDVVLFNSRVLHSSSVKNGLHMSVQHVPLATVIVATNAEREIVSRMKASCNKPVGSNRSIVYAAVDKLDDKVITESQLRGRMLNATPLTTRSDELMPPFITMFVGMPVILRKINLSTDLKLTNGASGIIRDILSHVDSTGRRCIDLVLVEFPSSPLHLSGIPKSCCAIFPMASTFPVVIEGEKHMVKRLQVPLQPGYCITGHFAQGRTLPAVVSDLTVGGFHAYVAASRPNNRDNLYLTKKVTLRDLNRPLPSQLVKEMERFNVMELQTEIGQSFMNQTSGGVKMPSIKLHVNDDQTKSKRPRPNSPQLTSRKRVKSVSVISDPVWISGQCRGANLGCNLAIPLNNSLTALILYWSGLLAHSGTRSDFVSLVSTLGNSDTTVPVPKTDNFEQTFTKACTIWRESLTGAVLPSCFFASHELWVSNAHLCSFAANAKSFSVTSLIRTICTSLNVKMGTHTVVTIANSVRPYLLLSQTVEFDDVTGTLLAAISFKSSGVFASLTVWDSRGLAWSVKFDASGWLIMQEDEVVWTFGAPIEYCGPDDCEVGILVYVSGMNSIT